MIISRDNFDKHFAPQIKGEVMVLESPNLAFMMDMSGQEYSTDKSKKYDTVIVDAGDYIPCPGAKIKHEKRWLDMAIQRTNKTGRVIVRVGGKGCQYLPDFAKVMNTTNVVMDGQNAIISMERGEYKSTKITYGDVTITQDITTTPILSYYNESHINILKGKALPETSIVQLAHNFKGRTDNYLTIKDVYKLRMTNIDPKNVLIISDGGPWNHPHTLEEKPDSLTGGRAVIMESPEDVEKVRDYLMSRDVIDFIRNVTFNRTHGLTMQLKRVICNPNNIA